MIVRHKYPGPGAFLRDDGEEAFRELCKLVLDKLVHPRGQTLDGKTFKAGRDQFIDLQDRYIFMAAALRYPAGVEGLGIEGPPSYELSDADGNRNRHAQLVFRESEIKAALGEVSGLTRDEAPSAAVSPKKSLEGPRSRRGAPPKYAWDAIREEAYRLMDHHGDFSDDDPEWNSQAKLEKKLQDFCSGKKRDKEPSPSTLRHRDKIPSWISEWRKQKRAVGN